MNQYTTLRDQAIPRRLPKPQQPKAPKTPQAERKRKCPSGFRWDSKKGKCVQAGVGPEYRP
jgi:hypothetical protein